MAAAHGRRDARATSRTLRGGTDAAYRDALVERFHLDTRQEGPRALEGQPAEGAARRGVRRPAPTSSSSTSPPAGSTRSWRSRSASRCARPRTRPDGLPLLAHPQRGRALCDRVASCATAAWSSRHARRAAHLSAQTIEVTFAGPTPALPTLPGSTSTRAARRRCAPSDRQRRPAHRGAQRAPRRLARQPRAVARGDLPAPLRARGRASADAVSAARARRARRTLSSRCCSPSPPRAATAAPTRRSPIASSSRAPSRRVLTRPAHLTTGARARLSPPASPRPPPGAWLARRRSAPLRFLPPPAPSASSPPRSCVTVSSRWLVSVGAGEHARPAAPTRRRAAHASGALARAR